MDSDSSSDDNNNIADNMSEDEVDDMEYDVLLVVLLCAILSGNDNKPTTHGGSLPGKLPNRYRNREAFEAQLNADYFDENPTYDLDLFERRFRMKQTLYLQIERRLTSNYRFFTQRVDAR